MNDVAEVEIVRLETLNQDAAVLVLEDLAVILQFPTSEDRIATTTP